MGDEKDDGRIWLDCLDCKRRFYLKKTEAEFYKSQQYALPRRCFNCRAWKKALSEKGD